jgi:uncharacterized protein (DUF1800 family)
LDCVSGVALDEFRWTIDWTALKYPRGGAKEILRTPQLSEGRGVEGIKRPIGFPRQGDIVHRLSLPLVAVLILGLASGCATGGGSAESAPPPVPGVVVVPQSASVTAGASVQVTAVVTDVPNATVTWTVNGVANGNSTIGTITGASGLTAFYNAPVPFPTPNNPVQITATIVANPAIFGSAMETLANAETANAADRLLEQSTFGPTPALVTNVSETGSAYFLSSQLAMPPTLFADPATTETNNGPLQQRYFIEFVTAPDQLRQRVAFALGQIFVISSLTDNTPQSFTPYLNLLETDAFTNYRQIMEDVTLSPAMGHYLDMVNNNKPTATTHADENYARELMQLFTLGENLINNDGSSQLDVNGNTIPTYSETQIDAFSRAYTGWTYPTMPGATLEKNNPAYWTGPMVPVETNHDEAVKQLLTYPGVASGGLLPVNQTAEEDLEGALDNIFNHPNLPAFVSMRLIQHLVTSNPSPAYIQRVANVFINNGSGVRGDMTAVITAILMDPEARQNDDPTVAETATFGHLQEPILYIAGLLRAFGATTDGSNLPGQGTNMGQTALSPGSVFNFYSPLYVIPGTTTLGPEFQILTTATTLARTNFVNTYVFGTGLGTGATVDFTSYGTEAANPTALLTTLNTLMLHGTMSSSMQSSILTAVQAVPSGSSQALNQAEAAIYLIASSSEYQVQH